MPRSTTSYDIVILGGGPGGVATALKLKQRDSSLNILIVEKSNYGKFRIGESLPPGTKAILEEIDAWETFQKLQARPAFGIESSWGRDTVSTNDFLFYARGHGWTVDRAAFDHQLAELAQKRGISLTLDTRIHQSEQTTGGRWTLKLQSKSTVTLIEAGFIVDATGRSASFARSQGAQPVLFDHLVGIHGIFPSEKTSPTFIEAFETGWWYSTSLPNGKRLVTGFTDSDLAQKLKESWPVPKQTQQTYQHSSAQPQFKTSPAHTQRLDFVAGKNWLATGDAASTYDPLSSQGIFKGLRSGIFAAYSILGGRDDRAKYERFITDEFEGYLETRAEFYATELRWPKSPFWQRRLNKIDLNPHALLTSIPNAPTTKPRQLTPLQIQHARDLCMEPTPAHRIASNLQQKHPSLSINRIILGLQHLLQSGLLQSQHTNITC